LATLNAQDGIGHRGGYMKKVDLSNKYIESIVRSSDGNVTIFSTDEKMFQLLLRRLWLFAESTDSGVEEIKRQFTYTSNADQLTVTIEKDVCQAINVLHAEFFFSSEEKAKILTAIQSETKPFRFNSVLDFLKSKRTAKTNSHPDETSKLLKKE
jgi:hypothetical protein